MENEIEKQNPINSVNQEILQEKTPEQELADFQYVIQNMKDGELKKKREWEERGRSGEAYDPHFERINPWRLGEKELNVWQKFQNGTLTANEYKSLLEEMRKSSYGVGDTPEFEGVDLEKIDITKLKNLAKKEPENFHEIGDFWAFIANKSMPIWQKEISEELKEKNEK